MTAGPIEFEGEGKDQATLLSHTEFGGAPGLIQPELDPLGKPGHELESSEIQSAMRRAELVGDILVDPVSGREIDDSVSEEVTGHGGEFNDLKP